MEETRIVMSRLSREIERDGMTVEVLIYRAEDETEWTLEVVDSEGTCTVWEDTFETESDALNEVFQTIAADGMASFRREPDHRLH